MSSIGVVSGVVHKNKSLLYFWTLSTNKLTYQIVAWVESGVRS
jgi:hypothetical protein